MLDLPIDNYIEAPIVLIAATATGASAVIGVLVIAALNFFPTFVATSRQVTNTGSVFVISLLFGWSVIG
jgi:hypothetical protein